MLKRAIVAVAAVVAALLVAPAGPAGALTYAPGPLVTPLHTTGTDTVIYDANNRPVRLVGFNWSGTELGGRTDALKLPDATGMIWRTPSDQFGYINFDNFYSVLRAWGYNTIRLPVSWNNLEPVAPVWDATHGLYVHSFSAAYVADLKSIVTRARAAGLAVILDMHQDYWSPALHNITRWDGTPGYAEGDGLPHWMYPSIDKKPATQQLVDFLNGMNWFYRNVHDPQATVTKQTPWQLFYGAWGYLSYVFSNRSCYPDYKAVIGADFLNEPYGWYIGANPPAGSTILQAAATRMASFYKALAPSVTMYNPFWLLFFEDATGGYNTALPDSRETPVMTQKPSATGNWVYSFHNYNFSYETFSDGVQRHDDFGITVDTKVLANARAWKVPLYIGEFTTFTLVQNPALLKSSDMTETAEFLAWAKQNGVSWTFWAYVGAPNMSVIDYRTNQSIAPVRDVLFGGL